MVMPGLSGIQVLEQLKLTHPECEVILLTGQGTIEAAVQAMKLGAYDFLTKPFPLAELEILIEKAYERRQLRKENDQLKAVLNRTKTEPTIIGKSPAMQEVFRLIERAGPTDKSILIQGESGTGKSPSPRPQRVPPGADKPMVTINCAALPRACWRRLFDMRRARSRPRRDEAGVVRGRRWGHAVHRRDRRTGRIAAGQAVARAGRRPICRVGSPGHGRRVNACLLAATNRDMEKEVAAGRFREDLYYRINVMSLQFRPGVRPCR
jgi:DNA-binding NtrC family response regulator